MVEHLTSEEGQDVHGICTYKVSILTMYLGEGRIRL